MRFSYKVKYILFEFRPQTEFWDNYKSEQGQHHYNNFVDYQGVTLKDNSHLIFFVITKTKTSIFRNYKVLENHK